MTSIFFVRHAQPEHSWVDDRSRPLTKMGEHDSHFVTQYFQPIAINHYLSSPYKRSIDTICSSAEAHGKPVLTDERLREREKGPNGNDYGMFHKRWSDFDFHEEGGESLGQVQMRNIEALQDVLKKWSGLNIVIGTHGTALSTILNFYDRTYKCDDFLRMIDYMPYIIRLDFEGDKYIGKEELLIIQKEFKGTNRADKND